MSAEQTRTPDEERLQAELRELAQEIAGSLSAVDAASGRELLSDFVSELFFCVTEQQRREDRRQKQAQGIAAAKARGVRFGRTARPVPDNFDQLHQAWREGRISLKQAAERAAKGDTSQISAIIQSVMKSPGGAELLERLNGVIGQK